MLLGSSILAPDAAIFALSVCFQNALTQPKYDVNKRCICRGLREPNIQETLQPKPPLATVHLQLPTASVSIPKIVPALQTHRLSGSGGNLQTQATYREPSSYGGVSIKRPLQRPLEQAISEGNWREAEALIEKLLLLGSLPDTIVSDHTIKGKFTVCKPYCPRSACMQQ